MQDFFSKILKFICRKIPQRYSGLAGELLPPLAPSWLRSVSQEESLSAKIRILFEHSNNQFAIGPSELLTKLAALDTLHSGASHMTGFNSSSSTDLLVTDFLYCPRCLDLRWPYPA